MLMVQFYFYFSATLSSLLERLLFLLLFLSFVVIIIPGDGTFSFLLAFIVSTTVRFLRIIERFRDAF